MTSLNTDGVVVSEQRFLELCEAERKLAELRELAKPIPCTHKGAIHDSYGTLCDACQFAWEKQAAEIVRRLLPAPKEGK